jgi:hypothetical protein
VENVGHTLQKRTFRKGERRNKRREEGRANAARKFILSHISEGELILVYHGEEGEWLKLQALQLMLRLQVQKMREIWQLPEVFEVRSIFPVVLAMAHIIDDRQGAMDLSISNGPNAQSAKLHSYRRAITNNDWHRRSRRGKDE